MWNRWFPDGVPALPADTLRAEIARAAYLNYLSRAGGPGCAQDDWLRAEREVLARRGCRPPGGGH